MNEGLVDFESSSKYRSFIFGQHNIGEAIFVFWYNRSQIQVLTDQENKDGIKKFPRFYLYRPSIEKFYKILDSLCWNHMLKHFSLQYNENLPSDSRHLEEKRLMQSHVFLNVLQSSYFAEICCEEENENQFKKYQLEDFNNIVWPVFRTDWMQELLWCLSINFMSDYVASTGKVDCSIDSIKAIVESYLGKICSYASSPKERKPVKEVANIAYQKRLEEAEKTFPNVKIVSQDVVISDIKVNISRWASVPFADCFLILGEPGTGKELFAKAIHEASKREGRFIKIDCGSIPLELFESSIFGHKKGSFTGAVRIKTVLSKKQKEEQSILMRSVICRLVCNQNCFALFKIANIPLLVPLLKSRSMQNSFLQRTKILRSL